MAKKNKSKITNSTIQGWSANGGSTGMQSCPDIIITIRNASIREVKRVKLFDSEYNDKEVLIDSPFCDYKNIIKSIELYGREVGMIYFQKIRGGDALSISEMNVEFTSKTADGQIYSQVIDFTIDPKQYHQDIVLSKLEHEIKIKALSYLAINIQPWSIVQIRFFKGLPKVSETD